MLKTRELGIFIDKIAIFMFLITVLLQASDSEQRLRLEIRPQLYTDSNYAIQGNLGVEKVFDSNDDWIRYYIRPSVSQVLDHNWALHGGLGFYFTDYQDIENNVETRPYLGISHFYPLTDKWKMSSYFRVEERCHDSNEDSTRLRFRLRTDYIINPLSNDDSWHKFMLSLEGFKSYFHDSEIDSVDTFDKESQLTLAIERGLSKQDRVRFELSWRYQEPPKEISTASVSTVTFRIQYYPVWGEILRNKLFLRGIEY